MYLHPSELRAANTRRLFRLLLAKGECSRARLARLSGLSAVTAGKVVDELITLGLVEEDAAQASLAGSASQRATMGRPPRIVRLSSRLMLPAVHIRVQETLIESLPLSLAEDRPRLSIPTPTTAAAFWKAMAAARRSLESPKGKSHPCLLVGVPGVLDPVEGRVLYSPNLRWTQTPGFLGRVAREWDAPLCAVQEVQALALGHQACGDAPDSFILVEFGDGVGGAVITGGHLFHGPLPLCGEIGHSEVFGNRRRCSCGAVGCLETIASRRGLLSSFRTAKQRPGATWADVEQHVFRHGVERWLASSIEAAAGVIAGAVNILGIQDVVLTGDLPSLHPDVLSMIGDRVQSRALIGRFGKLQCVTAPRRSSHGLLAAAADRVLLPAGALSGPHVTEAV